jgi:peroxiredoxin
MKLTAGDSFPLTEARLLDGKVVNLVKAHSDADWQMVVVYRGKHCPLCALYLNLSEEHKAALKAIGVSVSAVSADSKVQHEDTMEKVRFIYFRATLRARNRSQLCGT